MSDHQQLDDVFQPGVMNPEGEHPVLLVCEHASAAMPDKFGDLGLNAEQRLSHIAWDPGAFEVARQMSRLLNASLVYTAASRLLYDCNRPPEAADAIPAHSEDQDVPGNLDLTAAERQARVDMFYRPFEALVSATLNARPSCVAMVTVHSFTPVFLGQSRQIEIGILHDTDARLADAMLEVADGFNVARNEPYGPEDGVTHTLKRHALPRGLLNVMIEVRHDLIATSVACEDMAATLVRWLEAALSKVTEAVEAGR